MSIDKLYHNNIKSICHLNHMTQAKSTSERFYRLVNVGVIKTQTRQDERVYHLCLEQLNDMLKQK